MKFLRDLNDVQQQAVQAANGPVMIIAGAGSGKTRVLTYRIAYLLSCGVPPYQILALTFTNKAANEMKNRIAALAGEHARDLWMGTFHSIFARVLRKECKHLNFTSSFTIYDSDDSLNVIKKVMSRLNISTQQFAPQAVRSRISMAKNQYLSPDKFAALAHDFFDEKASTIYQEYQKTLQQSNAMDFDDLLVKPVELFEKHKDILEKYQQRFKFILVDEFQDTNSTQYRMVKLLGSAHNNIAVVGDDAQSIYSFRGADIRNILDFAKDFPDCKTFRLEQNYRSTKSIIAVADKLIRYNKEQIKKHLWTNNVEGDPISVIQCMDDREEGAHIVHAIQEECHKRNLNLKDFAVLYRTNAQSRALEDVFRRSAIPYNIVGGIRFYERKEIKDVLAYWRLMANPADTESLLRIINYPARGIGDTSLEYLRRFAAEKKLSMFDALARADDVVELTDRAKSNFKQFKALIEKYRSLRPQMSLSEWARSLVDELGILSMFKEERTAESMNRWENVQELLSAISEYSHEHQDATLESFLEEVALVADIDQWEGEKNAVTLMTLHASKGLEFPVVFIAGLEEGLLPFYSSTSESSDVEEERRLMYVGITRAEQKLYITHTKMRYRFGDVTYPSESRFLSELGIAHIEKIGTHSVQKQTAGSMFAFDSAKHKTRQPLVRKALNDEAFAGDTMPDYESESQEPHVTLKRGIVVQHEQFGKGKVIEVNGNGESQKVVVRFDAYGLKTLIAKYAKLRPA
ncbi:MAG TPA: UvrD-helicase domain-containing protein [Bacteroidota bacterium]|nr:UvrD-helicase domain-containing protein [Bacteroidota bacterium]